MNDDFVQSLFIYRKGEKEDAYMKTNAFLQYIFGGSFIFKNQKFIETENKSNNEKITVKPQCISVLVKWLTDNKIIGIEVSTKPNILGKFDKLEMEVEVVKIPIVIASKENVLYYDCELVENEDIVTFETNKKIPYFSMSVGKSYVSDYIMKSDIGGGIYLEYHNTPHFHSPIDAGADGFIVVGKLNGDKCELTGFKIPFGCGLYMSPYVIHNDCFLVGNWNVVYTFADEFSTALLMCGDKLVSFVY